MSVSGVLLGMRHETCVIVMLGSAVARTPARRVICGTGVGLSVGARVGDGVGPVAVGRAADPVALARAVGGVVGGGDVGVAVRSGSGGVGGGVGGRAGFLPSRGARRLARFFGARAWPAVR